jgi:hypothetical protein
MEVVVAKSEQIASAFVRDLLQGSHASVGIKLSHAYTSGLLKRQKGLAKDRLKYWFNLRLVGEKLLAHSILAHYNLFKAIRQNLRGATYRWTSSSEWPQLVDVLSEKGKVVLFQATIESFELFQKTMLAVCSHLVTLSECSNSGQLSNFFKACVYHTPRHQGTLSGRCCAARTEIVGSSSRWRPGKPQNDCKAPCRQPFGKVTKLNSRSK